VTVRRSVAGSDFQNAEICSSSGGPKSLITETSKNLHFGPGSLLKNLAV
jgi:hypothetical protein